MTGRRKLEAALSPGGTAEIPAVICYEGIYVRDHWQQLTPYPWWYQFETDVARQLAWRRDVLTKTKMDWFALPGCLPRARRAELTIHDTPEGVFQVYARTGRRTRLAKPEIGGWERPGNTGVSPVSGNTGVSPVPRPETAEQIDALVPLPPAFDAAATRAEGWFDLADAMLAEFGRELYPVASVSSPLWQCYSLWGYEELMVKVATQPELVERACERFLAQTIHAAQDLAARGAAGVWIEECMTDAISPVAFAHLNVPYVRRLVEAIRAAGLKSIYYYCGNPSDRWEELFAVGADALSLEESKKNFAIDIDEVVDRARGRCAVLGNLDAIGLLPRASEDELTREIARQIVAGRRHGGRFTMSLGSPVTPGTPVARVRRFCELTRQLGSL